MVLQPVGYGWPAWPKKCATALIPCLMLPVTAHPEYLRGVWSYQLKVESMKRLLVVYQIQDMDCLCDCAYGHGPWIDGFWKWPNKRYKYPCLWSTLRCLCDDPGSCDIERRILRETQVGLHLGQLRAWAMVADNEGWRPDKNRDRCTSKNYAIKSFNGKRCISTLGRDSTVRLRVSVRLVLALYGCRLEFSSLTWIVNSKTWH